MPFRLLLLLSCLTIVGTTHAQVAVVSVSPFANTVSAEATSPITATFSVPIDTGSVSDMSFSVFGLWSGVVPGTLTVSDDGLSITFAPSRPYSAGERVTVSIARSVASESGSSLAHGYSWHFFVATKRATMTPSETTRISVRNKNEGWIQTYGAYAGDFDEDGYTDLALPNERTNDFRLFLNDGTGFYRQFVTYPIPSGSRPSTNEGADFDRDGHIDFVVGNSNGSTVGLFMGDGKGALTAGEAFSVGLGVRGLAVLDLNGDNYPDVTSASRQASVVSTLINNREGSFESATTFTTPGAGETAAAAADMNEDGIMDVVIGTFISGQMIVLLGDGDGQLKFADSFTAGGTVWMIAAGDVNGDGHADIVSANSNDASVSVLLGDGNGGLGTPTVYAADPFTIAIDLGDLDGDGDLDMVASNFGGGAGGVSTETGSWIVYENLGNGSFSMRTKYSATAAGSCVVLHDRNNDGTLDITAIDELMDEIVLMTNTPVITDTEHSELPDTELSLELYPNPGTGKTSLRYMTSRPSAVTINVYDTLGRLVDSFSDGLLSSPRTQATFDLDLEHLSPGSYVVVLSTDIDRQTAVLQIAH